MGPAADELKRRDGGKKLEGEEGAERDVGGDEADGGKRKGNGSGAAGIDTATLARVDNGCEEEAKCEHEDSVTEEEGRGMEDAVTSETEAAEME